MESDLVSGAPWSRVLDDLGNGIYATAGVAMLVRSLGIAALAFTCARSASGVRRFVVYLILAVVLTLLGDLYDMQFRASVNLPPLLLWPFPAMRSALSVLAFPLMAWVDRHVVPPSGGSNSQFSSEGAGPRLEQANG